MPPQSTEIELAKDDLLDALRAIDNGDFSRALMSILAAKDTIRSELIKELNRML